jgi:hypothetical protein
MREASHALLRWQGRSAVSAVTRAGYGGLIVRRPVVAKPGEDVPKISGFGTV